MVWWITFVAWMIGGIMGFTTCAILTAASKADDELGEDQYI